MHTNVVIEAFTIRRFIPVRHHTKYLMFTTGHGYISYGNSYRMVDRDSKYQHINIGNTTSFLPELETFAYHCAVKW